MASPTVNTTGHRLRPTPFIRRILPSLMLRRGAAWVLEFSLLVASVAVPLAVGDQIRATAPTGLRPLNPVVKAVHQRITGVLALPANIPPLVPSGTNLAWTIALLLPMGWITLNGYLLRRTGKTIPKHWFKVRVVTATGEPPRLMQILLREGGRWGLALVVAHMLWSTIAVSNGPVFVRLTGLMLLLEGASALVHPHRRTWHDLLARTYVVDAQQPRRTYTTYVQTVYEPISESHRLAEWNDDEDAAIAAIVLTPDPPSRSPHWPPYRLLQNPLLTLLIAVLGGTGLLLGTFVGTQIYIQSQENRRQFKQQNNDLFLALLTKLSPSGSPTAPDERRNAILALGTIEDDRALPLLVDLLGQETNLLLVQAIEQALVSRGAEALPYLRRLNQSLRNEAESLRHSTYTSRRRGIIRQHRVTQRAITKILVIYSSQITADLSRVDLGQSSEPAPFTLVLDRVNLSGVAFRGANLVRGSFRASQFYGPGRDRRWGTSDDQVADFSGAELKETDFTGAMASYGFFDRANLIRATLNAADLSYARLIGANLSSAKLIRTNLANAVLQATILTGADLGNANLAQADLSQARLSRVNAQDANLQAANLLASDWQGADLTRATLTQANLQGVNLDTARLVDAVLIAAQFQDASLQETDLTGATLQNADFTGANLRGARFVSPAQVGIGGFVQETPNASKRSGLLAGANFTSAKHLDDEQIRYICAQGGIHPRCQLPPTPSSP